MGIEYRVVTRSSRLARIQTDMFVKRFCHQYPEDDLKITPITTAGDKTVAPLFNMKQAFSSDLEKLLLSGQADVAVHSLKDMSVFPQDDLKLAAVLERADCRDVLVSPQYASFSELPDGAVVGTSSARRCAQVRSLNPKILVKLCRGNVITRLEQLRQGRFDALILAAAGLDRLTIEHGFFLDYCPLDLFTPACGQGVIAMQASIQATKLIQKLSRITHSETARCVEMEHSIVRVFGGRCGMPLGVSVVPNAQTYQVRVFLGDVFGRQCIRHHAVWPVGLPSYFDRIHELTETVYAQGGQHILDQAMVDIERAFYD